MNASCGTCHDVRPIQTSAKDEAAWTETIDNMIEKGATLSASDRAILLPYLVKAHGPIPEGRGKDIVLNTCTICHDLTRDQTKPPHRWRNGKTRSSRCSTKARRSLTTTSRSCWIT